MSFRYILFHKPYGVLSQFSGGELCLRQYIPIQDVYPVGRLDKDSEGLMLLTNDGPLQHRLSDPKYEHPRTYWAQVDRIPSPDALRSLRDGVEISGGYRTRPAQARLIDEPPQLEPRDPPVRFRKNVPTAWIELTLTEGRNRQVRHMTAAIGHPTLRLIRNAIGKLNLAGLTAGQWRDLTPDELRYLRNSIR
ncbi:MAG: pseudouridine synthase [Acidobacteria bacterium]|nr:pseudouridine synthase [Acidobacteriota bacterium]